MSTLQIRENDRKFLLQSVRLCQAIDPYTDILGLDAQKVMFFKDYVESVLYITEHYNSFANSFFLYNIGTMRKHMTELVHDCLQSENYTKSIGISLGLEETTKFNAVTFNELPFYVHRFN
jgi:hypothetical protein